MALSFLYRLVRCVAELLPIHRIGLREHSELGIPRRLRRGLAGAEAVVRLHPGDYGIAADVRAGTRRSRRHVGAAPRPPPPAG
jgi:hypothetical protein